MNLEKPKNIGDGHTPVANIFGIILRILFVYSVKLSIALQNIRLNN